ncbi:hypothetical protein ABT346_14695 [Micromonospora peucetia]|uniref:hypothetical protein n=1 Tax=Micromonospora peucetia TaxID=47871 RepID=UPI00331C3679
MVSTIQTIGAILVGLALVAVVVVGLASSWKRRRRAEKNSEDGGGGYPTNEGSTPGDWGGSVD